jgi:hypothetical protein
MPPPRSSKPPPPRVQPDDAAVLALQNDLQRFEYSQRTQEWAHWLLYIEGPGVDPFCERLLRRRLVIGRDAGCSLPLQGEGMAPQHALLEHHDESDLWAVTPVSKEFPTFVNGKRAPGRTLLGPEDRVQIGPWRLRIGIEGDDEWHQKLRFATLHSPPAVPGLANVGSTKPDRLVVLSGPVPVKEIRLDEGPVRLGPVKGSSLVPEPGALAGLDVEITSLPDGRYELACNSDGQPVSVNGVVERRVVLAAGDRLCLGSGGGAAYLIFAARGPSPEGAAGEKKKAEASSRNLRAGTPALPSANRILTAPTPSPASEGGVVWSLQAIGLDTTSSPTPSWLDPPKLDDLPPSVEAPPAPEPKAGQAQRVSRPTAVLMVVTTFLLGVFFLGVTTLVRGRPPESNALADVPAPDAKPTPAPRPPPDEAREVAPPATRAAAVVATADAAATTRPADAPVAATPVALLPAAEPPAARPAELPAAAPHAAEPPAPRAAEPPAPVVRPVDMPVADRPARPEGAAVAAKPPVPEAARGPSEAARGPSAAPRPAEPAPRPTPAAKAAEAPRAPATKETPRPSHAAGEGGAICDRLRALQRSGRATPDDERMLQRCH